MLTVDSTEIDNRVREERLTALKVFAAVLGFTVLASLYLAGAIVRPIHRLADAAERIRAAKGRSEEHTSELQSLMRISYAVFCLKKKTKQTIHNTIPH